MPGRSFASRDYAERGEVALDHYADPMDEGEAVVGNIEAMLAEGYDANEIVCLYRTNAQAAPLEVALLKRGIRYRIAGCSFFGRAAVRTAMAYLRVALDPTDKDAWTRAYCLPLRGLGRTYLAEYPTAQAALEALHAGRITRRGWRRGTEEIEGHLDAIKAMLDNPNEEGLGAALAYISEDVGLRKHYRDEDAGDDDVTETDEMMKALIECGSAIEDPNALVEYAEDMAGSRKADHTGETAEKALVTLSTVHASKGLEWGTVFVVGFVRDIFPHKKAPYEEERRLAYVAITRAKDAAYISWTDTTVSGTGGGLSPLAAEIPALASAAYVQED